MYQKCKLTQCGQMQINQDRLENWGTGMVAFKTHSNTQRLPKETQEGTPCPLPELYGPLSVKSQAGKQRSRDVKTAEQPKAYTSA